MKRIRWGMIALAAFALAPVANAHERSSRSTASPSLGKSADHKAALAEDDAYFLTSDKLFLWRLHWINHAEIQSGELAHAKARTEGVQRYGAMLMRDHREAEEKLLALADDKEIVLELTKAEYQNVRDRLAQQMTGMMDMAHEDIGEFERQFLTHMRADHANAIRLVKQYRQKTKDKEIRAHLDELLPVLQKHEDEARKLLGELGGERRDVRGVDRDPAELPERKSTKGNLKPEERDLEREIEEGVEPEPRLDADGHLEPLPDDPE